MKLKNLQQITKEDLFKQIEEHLSSFIRISSVDNSRPWGGFFVINEEDAEVFIREHFPHLNQASLSISGKLSPKILVVAPGKRLSWQYHHRRAEIWKSILGSSKIVTSDTDIPTTTKLFSPGDIVELKKGERHRLEGLDDWAIIAEIWIHTEADNPSDEEDIVRIEDDFGR